jgi:plastocyanin domain-containing protein
MMILINILALALIGFIVWWFWLAKGQSTRVTTNSIDVIVDDGSYTPGVIEVAEGEPVTLNFIRRDASPCAEKVIFADLDVSADLPLNQARELRLQPPHAGVFEFTCQMGMYRGKLIVK